MFGKKSNACLLSITKFKVKDCQDSNLANICAEFISKTRISIILIIIYSIDCITVTSDILIYYFSANLSLQTSFDFSGAIFCCPVYYILRLLLI